MRRPGSDDQNLEMADFLCDFCRAPWVETLPMVEGHEGALICGRCLKVAYVECLLGKTSSAPAGTKCLMCLEERQDRNWKSPEHENAVMCERCIRQAATALAQDPDGGWAKPG